MKFFVRAFVANTGGAYDPAPLPDFDLENSDFIPVVGDLLQWDKDEPIYEVRGRHFNYAARLCSLNLIERKNTSSKPLFGTYGN